MIETDHKGKTPIKKTEVKQNVGLETAVEMDNNQKGKEKKKSSVRRRGW